MPNILSANESTPQEAVDILRSFFPSGVYSVSAVCRKSLSILMLLCARLPGSWYANFSYEAKTERYITRFISKDYDAVIHIAHDASDETGRKKKTYAGEIDSLFVKDKFIPVHVRYGKVSISTNIGNFIYEKSKSVSTDDELLHTLHVKRGSWSLKGWLYRYFGDTAKVINIQKAVVLEQELAR